MAAPTAPTLATITSEGIKKAGYSSPSTAQLTRAQDEWMEEIKNDIWLLGKKLKPLMAEHVEVLAGGQARYDFPSGFSSITSARILYGTEALDVTGTAAASVTLDTSDEDWGEDELEGTEILIYSGTGKGSMSRCYSYDEDTYVASVSPAWASAVGGTAPAIDDTYMKVERYYDLELESVVEYDSLVLPQTSGLASTLYQVGHENHYGYYVLSPVPDEDYYYGVHIRYYMNLLTLDLASTRMSTLYQRWRNLWIQGIKARQLATDDDSRATLEMQTYYSMAKDVVALETYPRNVKQHYRGIRA